MKTELCTSDFIYIYEFLDGVSFVKDGFEEDTLYINSVSYEEFTPSPVSAQDLAAQQVNGWHNVELTLGEDLNWKTRSDEYEPGAWYIVGDDVERVRKCSALISD